MKVFPRSARLGTRVATPPPQPLSGAITLADLASLPERIAEIAHEVEALRQRVAVLELHELQAEAQKQVLQ